MTNPANEYTPAFYAQDVDASIRTTAATLPEIFRFTGTPGSIVDFGTGVGYWLEAARALGITDVHGYDGDYVQADQLRIPRDQFTAVDLNQPVDTGRRFDLALCLEVAEHLPASSAATLVDSLVRAAPIIAFSAAIPCQGGVHHVNEQWPRYWADLFEARGYETVDVIRRHIWEDPRIVCYYRQNLILYVESNTLRGMPELHTLSKNSAPHALPLVHPTTYVWRARELERPWTLKRALRQLGSVIKKGALRRGMSSI